MLLVLLLIAVVLLIAGFVFLDRDAWGSSRRLSAALQGARKVELFEYAGDVEIARRTATADEISQLRNAVNIWPQPFFPSGYLCFEPHHRIEIVRADGSRCISAVCFLCDKFAIDEDPYLAPLPPYLAKSLVSFFTSVGMAPKTADEYATIEASKRSNPHQEANSRLE
jgi:hypothetical protein